MSIVTIKIGNGNPIAKLSAPHRTNSLATYSAISAVLAPQCYIKVKPRHGNPISEFNQVSNDLYQLAQAFNVGLQNIGQVSQCAKCKWQFTAASMVRPCPSCGSPEIEATTKLKPDQSEWLELRHQQDRKRAIEESKADKCCWTATHTRGWHHDPSCKNWVVGY